MSGACCCQCGQPRSATSGKRCRRCYLANAADRRRGGTDGELLSGVLNMENRGEVVMKEGVWFASPWHWQHNRKIFR